MASQLRAIQDDTLHRCEMIRLRGIRQIHALLCISGIVDVPLWIKALRILMTVAKVGSRTSDRYDQFD